MVKPSLVIWFGVVHKSRVFTILANLRIEEIIRLISAVSYSQVGCSTADSSLFPFALIFGSVVEALAYHLVICE